MKVKERLSDYYKPTPVFFRRLGDSLLAVSVLITATAIAEGEDWLAYTSLGIGAIGKFFTNFFKEEKSEEQEFEG